MSQRAVSVRENLGRFEVLQLQDTCCGSVWWQKLELDGEELEQQAREILKVARNVFDLST